MMNQKEATYNAIISAFENANVSFESGDVAKDSLTAEMRSEVRETLFTQFRNSEVVFSDTFAETKLNNDSELKKYIAGLVSNWVKKDKRLNGNVQYKIANPGSRAGQGDEQVKALRSLIKQLTVAGNTDGLTEAKEALTARQATLAAAKATKSSPINVDALPEHLKNLVKSND